MLLNLLKSRSVKFIIIGYVILVGLFFSFWFVDSGLLKHQYDVIDSTGTQVEKMRILVHLVEIARKRINLSHEMLASDDVFERDEIGQKISSLASEFIIYQQELRQQLLTESEREFLDKQAKFYPVIVGKIREVTELALKDSDSANAIARNIIIDEIVPMQGKIVDGFIELLSNIQQEMDNARQNALSKYFYNTNFRVALSVILLLSSFVILFRTSSQIFSIEQKLYLSSVLDSLTGLANRGSFDTRLDAEWKRCGRDHKPLSILLIDVDYFKKYNDFYGHQEGDKCLAKIAYQIQNLARRGSDLAARYGGEEFAVILPVINNVNALLIAHKLLENIRDQKIPHKHSEISDVVTVSIGIATLLPSNESSPNEIIKMADKALYVAKKNGRNQTAVYEE